MKVWKLIPLLLVVFTVSSCTSASSDDTTKSAEVTAPANTPAPAPTVSAPPTKTAPATPKSDAPAKAVDRTEAVTIPADSEVTVILSSSLNSGKNKAGDEFEGNLAAPLSVNGRTVLDRGTKVMGKVVDAE